MLVETNPFRVFGTMAFNDIWKAISPAEIQRKSQYFGWGQKVNAKIIGSTDKDNPALLWIFLCSNKWSNNAFSAYSCCGCSEAGEGPRGISLLEDEDDDGGALAEAASGMGRWWWSSSKAAIFFGQSRSKFSFCWVCLLFWNFPKSESSKQGWNQLTLMDLLRIFHSECW